MNVSSTLKMFDQLNSTMNQSVQSTRALTGGMVQLTGVASALLLIGLQAEATLQRLNLKFAQSNTVVSQLAANIKAVVESLQGVDFSGLKPPDLSGGSGQGQGGLNNLKTVFDNIRQAVPSSIR
ncbi:MAG TPA: hypothetical protein VFV52_00145, partial [Bacilli bacterium]|nr:hypothetical protein [Bacilli bacterium]